MTKTASHLFIYGTLLFDQVWLQVVGNQRVAMPARLLDWQRLYVKNKLYPGIKYQAGSYVDGELIYNLTPEDWHKLDDFEDKLYTRKLLDIICDDGDVITANVYVVENENVARLTDHIWLPRVFENNNELHDFIRSLS